MSEQLRTRGPVDVVDTRDRVIRRHAGDVPGLVVGALLALAVGAVHVYDQGGFPSTVDLTYMRYGYYAIEVVGVVAAVLLFTGRRALGWFLAFGVAAGPLVGYVLSRGPGLPDDGDDIGNWTQPDGLISLSLEAVLIVLAVLSFVLRDRERGRT